MLHMLYYACVLAVLGPRSEAGTPRRPRYTSTSPAYPPPPSAPSSTRGAPDQRAGDSTHYLGPKVATIIN